MENLGEFIVNHWILVSLFVVLSWLVFSDGINKKLSGTKSLSVTDTVRVVNQLKGRYLDVRTAEEFEKEHIADSINIPMSDLPDGLTKLKDKTKPVIVVCASGQRAKNAAKSISKQGFEDVYVLSGGIHAWKEAKLPLFG